MVTKQKCNIIMLGDGAVGKTSILRCFSNEKIEQVHMATLGLDCINKEFKPRDAGPADSEMLFKIWDTAGQERFRTLTLNFYK